MNEITKTHRRFLALSTAAALALGGITLVGCDDDEAATDADSAYASDPAAVEGETPAGGMAGTVETTAAEIQTEITEIVGGEGTVREKLDQLLESGQERFDALGEQFDDVEGGDATASFFGDLNEKFDALQASVSDGDLAGATTQFTSLQSLQVPGMARPYVQPYMDSVSNLMGQMGNGAVGNAVGNAAGRLMGGNNTTAPSQEAPPAGEEGFDAMPESME